LKAATPLVTPKGASSTGKMQQFTGQHQKASVH